MRHRPHPAQQQRNQGGWEVAGGPRQPGRALDARAQPSSAQDVRAQAKTVDEVVARLQPPPSRSGAASAQDARFGDENDTEQASGQQNGGEQPSGAVSKRHRRRLKRLTQAATFVLDEQLGTDASKTAIWPAASGSMADERPA